MMNDGATSPGTEQQHPYGMPHPADLPTAHEAAQIEATGPDVTDSGAELPDPAASYPEGTLAVPLGEGGPLVHILPAHKWRSSAQTALRNGDFEFWAEKCLAGADYEEIWLEEDPEMGAIEQMFTTWGKASGNDPGKSRGSGRSSTSSGRR